MPWPGRVRPYDRDRAGPSGTNFSSSRARLPLAGKFELELPTQLECGPLTLADEVSVLGHRADQDGHGDGRVAVDGDHARIPGDLAPALSFLKRAAGKPAPVRGVRDDLKGVLVPVRRVAHEGRRHFALLDEILGRPSAKIDHSACGRFARQAGGLEDVTDHVKHQTVFSQVAVFPDADADGGVADRGGADWEAGLVSPGDDGVLF